MLTPGSLYSGYFNGSWYNFTEPFNSTVGNIDNSNASRHFADDPQTADILHIPITIIFIISAVPCGLIIIGSAIFWLKDCTKSQRMRRSSRTEANGEASLTGTCRPGLLSIVQNGVSDQMIFQNGDEIPMIDTPSSIYPSDMLPSYTDSTRNLYSDTITTPLSNNSIITMTMRNNYLIVETEERIPVYCSSLTKEELYRSRNLQSMDSFITPENDYRASHMLDDIHSYSEEHLAHLCTVDREDKRAFYGPTTSRHADEEEQHVELFHKNILVFPSSYEPENNTFPSCSYNYNEEPENSLSYGAVNTGFTQSDLTGSSSSTSRHAQADYGYSNQCEYISCDFPNRKRSSSLKTLSNVEGSEILVAATTSHQNSAEDSVLQITDCSSPEYSEPSK